MYSDPARYSFLPPFLPPLPPSPPSLPPSLQHLDFVDAHEQQVLHYASSQGLERLVTELLHRGVGVDTIGGKLRHTPLMLGKGSRVVLGN